MRYIHTYIGLDWKSIAEAINHIKFPSYQTLLNKYTKVLKDKLYRDNKIYDGSFTCSDQCNP